MCFLRSEDLSVLTSLLTTKNGGLSCGKNGKSPQYGRLHILLGDPFCLDTAAEEVIWQMLAPDLPNGLSLYQQALLPTCLRSFHVRLLHTGDMPDQLRP